MKIGDIEVGNLFLAPMAGVTEVGFRTVCKMCGADLTYTEMINAKAMRFNNQHTSTLLYTEDVECPKVVQIFGNNAEDLAQVCKSPLLEKFDIIDINFGCPAPKIVKNGEGSALLKDLEKLEQIVKACVSATTKPVTAKFRIGFADGDNVAVEVAKICERNGIKAITVHGRTREQMYSGKVDYETIKKVKQSVSIPVIGNGDVVDEQSYKKMLETGVDGVMVARGALGNPWLFARLKGQPQGSRFEMIKKHIEVLKKHYDEKWICIHIRKHLLWYTQGIDGASKIRLKLATTTNLDESLALLKQVLN